MVKGGNMILNGINSTRFGRVSYFVHNAMPLVFDESLSYLEILSKILDYINSLIEEDKTIYRHLEKIDTDINTLKNDVKFLNAEMEKCKNGEYLSIFMEKIKEFILQNIDDLILNSIRFVSFELSEDGHYVVYTTSKNWRDEIEFDTEMNYENANYMHLMIKW